MAAKSVSIKGVKRKSGGCARKEIGLTSGGLRRVREDWGGREAAYRGAEVSRGRSTGRGVGPLDRDTRPKGEKRLGIAGPATANRKARTVPERG